MSFLMQVSIGPVQGFIAGARRTRDLWYGSWLLSELAKAAALVIAENHETLIFPAPLKTDYLRPHSPSDARPDSLFDAPNKIIAIVAAPQTLGPAVQQAVYARRDRLWDEAQQHITGARHNTEHARAQINDMVECVWVALPLGDYAVTRRQLDNMLAARKNTRDFAPVGWGGNQPKSTITGQLESVIPEELYPRRPHRSLPPSEYERQVAEYNRKAELLQNTYCAGPAERLSAVDLLKRNGGGQRAFVSTSHMAALPFLEQFKSVSEPDVHHTWQAYLDLLPTEVKSRECVPDDFQHPFFQKSDGALLFAERLDDVFADKERLAQAKDKLQAFYRQAAPVIGNARPSPYYAILHADGDYMGAVIDHEATCGYERHQALSQELARFAADARRVIGECQGATIYAGGDDVLALLPLHQLLECAKQLAEQFSNRLEDFSDTRGRKPTLSVGVAVVHHLTPLSDALDLARAAETTAKKVKDKNALAITVSKRSGGETTVCGKWGDLDNQLETFIQTIDLISAGAAYELRDLAARLETPPEKRSTIFAEMIRTEARRILQRKRADGKAIPEKTQGNLVERIAGDDAIAALYAIADDLIVARLLADAQRLAGQNKEAPV